MTDLPRLSIDLCHARQDHLRASMEELKADRALITSRENVHWLTGYWTPPLLKSAAVLDLEGNCTLLAPNTEPDYHASSLVKTFPASSLCTLRQDQVSLIADQIEKPEDIAAVEFPDCPILYREKMEAFPIDIDPAILNLRRKKDPDELGMLSHAIGCTHAMYLKAREIIHPGITELEVFAQLHAAGVAAAGEPLTACGNDYQSNAPGGPPRDREARDGELMILDLGPAYRGYHADNCRTFAVNQSPTDVQLAAYEIIQKAQDMIATKVRPGVSCREIYLEAKEMLDAYETGSFFHHLGHGIGLYPHESPHLNPAWDETFEVGDFFAAEPGIYSEELRAGIRIEENYLVTDHGVEKLTTTPTGL